MRGQVSGMKMGAWVSLVKSQLVEDEGKAGLKMKREGEVLVGRSIVASSQKGCLDK